MHPPMGSCHVPRGATEILPSRHLQIFFDRYDLLTLLTVQIITMTLIIDGRSNYFRDIHFLVVGGGTVFQSCSFFNIFARDALRINFCLGASDYGVLNSGLRVSLFETNSFRQDLS